MDSILCNMASHQEPCNICGGRSYELHDGFFYCTECGTQDVRAQEALFEVNVKQDGNFFKGNVQKIRKKITGPEERMPSQWYRWHTMNFILCNTADELIALGANPSFKNKLLWIWTKYLKEYVKKSHLGLSEKEEDILKSEEKSDTETTDSDEEKYHNILNRYEESRFKTIETHHCSILAMIYLALNMDGSHIQLSHLLRYVKEFRLSFPNQIRNIVPEQIFLNQSIFTKTYHYSQTSLRLRAMALCKKLKLGCPVVPDLRLIVEEYIKELCLPHDFKLFVFSLMDFYPCDFLDILVTEKYLNKIPNYELHCMTYILWGLKLCFGLDCDYELKLSKAVDKINEKENYPRAYFNSPPNSTERLFSFREWCTYIQFRKKILQKHCRFFRHKVGLDVDSYVAVEQFENLPDKSSKDLIEDIAMEITQKIPGGNPPYGIVPESEFKPCTTPYFTYARVIAEYLQDPDVKLALSEDFTQYSMKYVTEDLYLVDIDDEEQTNLVTGISADSKKVINTEMENKPIFEYKKNLVYVKDCDNHNWMTTNPPEVDHLIKFDLSKGTENEDGKIDLKIDKKGDLNNTLDQQDHFETITEENADVNIFDDDFITLNDTKIEIPDKEIGRSIDLPYDNLPFEPDFSQHENISKINNEEQGDEDAESTSSIDSLDFDPSNFDREKIIKELVLMKCKKYKIPVPPRYKPHLVRSYDRPTRTNKQRRSFKANLDRQHTFQELLQEYYANVTLNQMFDQLQKVANDVHNVMNNIQKQQNDIEVNEPFETSINTNNFDDTIPEPENNNDIPSKLDFAEAEKANKTTGSCEEYESGSDDNLFNQSSEGETYGVEFIPPKNPKYDEEKYDKKQLYLNVKQPDIPDIELDDTLSQIIETKMEKDAKDPSLLEWKNERVRTKSESDDDIPLSEISRQNELYNKIRKQSKMSLPPFFEGKTIKDFKHWFNFYAKSARKNMNGRSNKMESELFIYFPKSFKFVIETCASIVNCETAQLVYTLENCEQIALSKCKVKVRRKKNVRFILEI